jgi:hypothetical protein
MTTKSFARCVAVKSWVGIAFNVFMVANTHCQTVHPMINQPLKVVERVPLCGKSVRVLQSCSCKDNTVSAAMIVLLVRCHAHLATRRWGQVGSRQARHGNSVMVMVTSCIFNLSRHEEDVDTLLGYSAL